ncbi:hypothetical protein QBC35DRAFT_546045 [Podospora australis]|uniref:FAD-binding PCMH-type domain-containing protein n=1 Tax=Podospora australis TaxID=1536484 RepID=A0AAN7ADN4_9PEZI|nr:hypothetical protein QBC35DRAFT_546045 [Podospora australis]
MMAARVGSLLSALAVVGVSVVDATFNTAYKPTCTEIETIGNLSSASNVIWPVQAVSYSQATKHWFLSSDQNPSCVIEPATPEDISKILQIVGPARIPFAIQSGGHASNPGFSSTQGVHISLKKLNQVILSEDRQTVEVGFGQTWKDIYDALEPYNLNVVGGRVIGPGVGGFTLGGGYSWKTNQFGLTCDTVERFNIVLPNGTITYATDSHNPDLFWALKGGQNRFGIVTSAVIRTHPQSQVWGGLRIYPSTSVPALLNATKRFFYENTDPKASIITTLEGSAVGTTALVLFFYDGPEKPSSFDLFDGIPYLISSTSNKKWTSFLQSFPASLKLNLRGTFATVSTSELTPRFLEAVKNETDSIGKEKPFHSGTTVSYDIEPFTNYGQHSTESAFPHADSPLPLNLYFSWAKASDDVWWYNRMKESLVTLKQVAIEEGIFLDSYTAYPNYAISGTTAEELYGVNNAARLRAIRSRIDPDRVMDLAGGFEI